MHDSNHTKNVYRTYHIHGSWNMEHEQVKTFKSRTESSHSPTLLQLTTLPTLRGLSSYEGLRLHH